MISRKDRSIIDERMGERNKIFKMSTNNYLRTVSKEIETIRKTSE